MSPEEAIKSLTLAQTDIVALIASRIYPDGSVPQKTTRPFSTFYVPDSKSEGDLSGGSDICRETITLSFYAETRLQAKTLAEYSSRVTPNGLANYKGTVVSGADSLDVMGIFVAKKESKVIDMEDGSDSRLFCESTDFMLVYEK